ncbi:MAG: ATP synthase F1 subunit delta [Flavobacteriales bacterium]|nr:ATP synthase F1 subunit delta [Flavobacteriales bacterium]MCB9335491.1 ATP synthase F1 subunit delta [Flavobacteriales bacterium]
MRDIKVASRYAKSLLGIALEQNALESIHQDMMHINQTCNANRDLTIFLKSPIIKSDKKLAILNELFSGINQISKSFISIIVSKKREGILEDIAVAFIDAYKVHKNIKTVSITTAIALNESQKKKIADLVNKDNSTIELKEIINPEIIGGMILRVGDTQVDESIKRKLTNLEMEFDDNPYIKEY